MKDGKTTAPSADAGAGCGTATGREQALRTGGQVLVDQLLVHGVRQAFCVPGESYLAVLDALYDVRDALALAVCRHEGGASNMAEAWGKLGNGPGICFVTRGPGATNAAIGVHTARQDSTPMILFVGQVGTDFVDREAFQEIDYRRMFGSVAKWVASIDRADRIPELVSQAFHVATSGRPGPVVIALPEDMLVERVRVADAKRYRPAQAGVSPRELAPMLALLERAERPLLLLGGSRWTDAARQSVRRFAAAHAIPVACAWRFQDSFDNADPLYVGEVGIGVNPKLAARVREADALIVVGARLGEMTTNGYTLLDAPTPRQPLVHVYPDPDEIGRVYAPAVGIVAGNVEWAQALDDLAATQAQPTVPSARARWLADAHADYERWRQPPPQPGAIDYPAIVLELDRCLPPDAILTNGAGNFATPVHRFYRHRGHKTQLAPTSGAMGYAVPSAVAAKLCHPDRVVIAVTGDGDFLMTGQELATACQYSVGITVLVLNNGMYGTIRMHQERHYPARVHGTALSNPRFDELARAYGCVGVRVERTAQFADALATALEANRNGQPALIEIMIDPEALTVGQTLSQIRAQAEMQQREDADAGANATTAGQQPGGDQR
ncbi:MAG: thiamine pyrophosphate-binding protein [Lautropia sp.]